MKSPRQIEKIVGKAQAGTGRATDERILTDAEVALYNYSDNRPQASRPGPTIWRFIMESKVTKYSAAAVVALAAALVLMSPFSISKNGSIVLADVVNKVHRMNTVIHKEKRTVREIGKQEPSGMADVVKYLSEEHGYAEHSYDENGALMFRAYFLKETRQFIIVFPAEKKYMKLSLPEEIFKRLTMILTPGGLVDYCTSLKYTELGRAEFDNFDVEGFETTDPNVFPIPEPLRLVFPARDLVARLWIDVETSLPVGIESEFNTDRGLLTGFKRLHGEFKAYDIQWNAELPEGVFDPNIPDDYTELKVTDFIPTEAKAGLVGMGIVPVGFVLWRRRRKRAKSRQRE
jgi:hypothetical protein